MPQIVDERKFPSKTSGAVYTAVMYDDGTTSCNCRGWTFKKPGQERECRHTVTLRTGTVIKVVTNAEMARMALRGEQFDVVKRWTNALSGTQMVSLRMIERRSVTQVQAEANRANEIVRAMREARRLGETQAQREARLNAFERDLKRSPRDRDSAREQFRVVTFQPPGGDLNISVPTPRPQEPRRAAQIEQPERARIAFDEEV